nr:hypothetical protein [uncultured Actinoplanes sp.]
METISTASSSSLTCSINVASLEELEQRIAAMEAEMAVVRQEAAAARALAAGADRDVAEYHAELRGHTRVLSALRETQLDHYGEHKADAAEINSGLAQIVRLLEGQSAPTTQTPAEVPDQRAGAAAAIPTGRFPGPGQPVRGGCQWRR